uniref:Putative tail tape measure protein n=1 Tax=viral metagenome TaxID=1070528 RepID=A0A6M3LXY4_9ZZZZ
MADKRLRLIVEAVTSSAQANLKSLSHSIEQLGAQGAKGAGDLGDLQQRANRLLGETQRLGQEAKELGRDMEASAQGTEAWSAATSAAADAAVMLGAGFALLKLGEKVLDFTRAAAAAQALETGFDKLASRGQVDSQLLLESLDKAAKGTVSDYDLMKEANEAWYLGITKNTDQYVDLMKIAEERSKDLGISTLEYWQRLTSALSSGYSISLRQLGIVIDMDRAYENYAVKIGTVADELDEQERAQARVEAAIVSGASSIADWESAEEDATTATQQFDAATANLAATIKEDLLPVLVPAINWIAQGLQGIDAGIAGQNEAFAQLVKTTGSVAAAEEEFAKRITIASQGMIDGAEAARQAHTAMLDYKIDLIGIDKGIQEDIRAMRMAENATIDWGKTIQDNTKDLEELAKAQKKAADIWGDYGRSVAQENWQMARRVADAQFSAGQAAERAAYDLYKIQRDAGDRTGDLMANAAIRDEADTARHYAKLRYMKQDLNDALADMDWDYQRERSDIIEKAPWWIRYALTAEYAQRERITASGDAKALEQYDEYLNERIKAIDPAYAIELDKIEDQHEHKEDIEERETRQALDRAKDGWNIQQREQAQAMDRQLFELGRDLGYQLDEWHFHQAQREESERHSMENIITDHEHSLSVLWDNTQRKLAELPSLYKHYGYENWVQFIKGWTDGQADYPQTINAPAGGGGAGGSMRRYQAGAWDIPRNELAYLHKGEMVLPAGMAQQVREVGGPITINLNLGGGYSPYQGQQIAAQIATELGQGIRRSYR